MTDEPASLILEQLRLLRDEGKSMRDEFTARFDAIEQRLTRIEINVQGLADIAVNTAGMLRSDRLRQLEAKV
jgi:hypothetical protein